jgi:hypothetical protein
MRGMGHSDPIETVNLTHEEGNEGEKIGVKRGFGAFYGAKLLKRWGAKGARLREDREETGYPTSGAFREVAPPDSQHQSGFRC